jgi:mono/diheme cytochrome c family protein
MRIQHPESRIVFTLLFSLTLLTACSPGKSSESVKFQQYYVQGEQLYEKHCSNCHQSSGTGLGLVYPPLNKSDYMENNMEAVLCLMKYGMQGEVVVNGKIYIQPMPDVASLTDLEIAQIATYIYNTWEHQRGLIDVLEANRVLKNCE